jgi:hypothetical protein
MKLEILKDNKTTKARVGSIMIVSNHMGAQWIEKGWAKDLVNYLIADHVKKDQP